MMPKRRVAYLASEECGTNGDIFSVAGGRVTRIFIAEGPGFFNSDLTIEDVRDNLEAICAQEHKVEPTNTEAEIALLKPYLSDLCDCDHS